MADLTPILDALIAHHLAILGKTGMGKSYVGKLLVEYELRLHHRVVIIDPTGVYWGLKAGADGKSAGFPIAVLGGDHADRPLLPGQGREIARILGATNLPTALDIADMKVGEQQTFVSDFTDEIFSANRGALRLVIDEADAFAPQGSAPEQRKMFGHVDRIVRRGRSRGLYVTMISQRPAALHKNVLSQVDALVVLGVTAPQDRRALLAWVEGNTTVAGEAKAFTDSLPGLKRGTGWAWAPKAEIMERVEWPAITTFDSGRTPKHGETIMPPQTLASVDLSALDAVEHCAKSADIGQDRSKSAEIVYRTDPAELERAREAAYREGFHAGRMEERYALRGWLDSRTVEAERKIATATAPGDLTSAARKLLSVLQARHPARFTWGQTATLASLAPRGGSFNTARKALRESGLIVETDGLVAATVADASTPPRTPGEVLDDWCAKLPTPAPQMLRTLVNNGPMDRVELAVAIGREPRGGSWNTGLATLRRNDLITENAGRLAAVPELRE